MLVNRPRPASAFARPSTVIAGFAAALVAAAVTSVPVLAQGPPNGLPPQASSQAEVVVEGELEVLYEDGPQGAQLRHFLRTANERLTLRFTDDADNLPPGLATGARIRARGRLQNGTLELRAGGGNVETVALASSTTFGEQRTLVILVNFQDAVSQPYSLSHAYNVTFGENNNFFQENSYGQTWFTGTVAGWFTIPMSSTSCDYYQIASLAEQAASGQGINVSQFNRRVIAFPQMGACGWWGLGNVGGNPSRSWINGNYALKVVAHELGHNFGSYHSKSQSCDTGGCSVSEYGDQHDVMGSPTGHLNAFQKERVGWLNYLESPAIQTVSAAGTYWIDTMSTTGTAPKALKILKGNGTYYYVETRARLGFDGGLSPGVLVHTGSSTTGNSSLQIDMTPTAAGFDSVLDVGQTFRDDAIGLVITTMGVNSSGASVFIDYPGAPCTTRSPNVTISPGSTTVTTGGSATLTMSVRNNDDSTCAPTEFVVGGSVPSGWGLSAGASSLTVAPGATASTSLLVVPAAGASGASTVTGRADRATTSGPGGSDTATVVVATALDVSLTVSSGKGGYTFDATVSAGGSPMSGVVVTFTVTDPNGGTNVLTAVTDGSGRASTRWKPGRRDPKGTYQVTATASAGGLSGSASGTFRH